MSKSRFLVVTRIFSATWLLCGAVVFAGVMWDRLSRVPITGPPPDRATLVLPAGHGVMIDLVRIKAGRFDMGSPDGEADRDPSEGPRHSVTIGRDFFIGKFEITQAQWVAVMTFNQSQFPDNEKMPAESVSWGDCQKFCDILSQQTGRHVRLPSEAEWEYACRAGTTTVFSSGDSLSSDQANFNGQSPYGDAAAGPTREKPMAVGSFAPNAFGLFDMAGNVSEWCQDLFHDSYEGAPVDGSAWMSGGADEHLHVYRGGAYSNDGSNCRSAVRFAADADTRTSIVGFRIVVDVRDDQARETR